MGDREMLRFTSLIGSVLCASNCAAQLTDFQDAVSAAVPLLWYQFNESTGDVVNHGSLGVTQNAAVNGAVGRDQPTLTGDTSMQFSAGAWLESLSDSDLTGNPDFSVEAVVWLDLGGTARQWGPFLHWGDGGVQPSGREVYFSIQRNRNNVVYGGFYNGGMRTVTPVAQDAWLHVVWTRVGGGASDEGTTIYINGMPMATTIDRATLRCIADRCADFEISCQSGAGWLQQPLLHRQAR